ncbi:MAG: WD40 repeat domain-containing protein, partial [Anaerolineae bacterium]
SGESIYHQIHQHMDWIQSNPTASLEKAKQAHEIYKEKFLLENQLLRLAEFHNHLSQYKNIFSIVKKHLKKALIACISCLECIGAIPCLSADKFSMIQTPFSILANSDNYFSLINSVDFHPQKNLFCVTYTHNNKIILYTIDANNKPQLFQSLTNPSAGLSEPQHAVFSPNGEKIVVANWTNQTLILYECEKNGFFSKKPLAIIPSPIALNHCKPHSLTFSPCGNYLAIAYGAASKYGRAIALFHMAENIRKKVDLKLVSLLEETLGYFGIPKGVAFSPDGTCLLVSFTETNSLVIFNIDKNHSIDPVPRQIIQGQDTRISRPEDVKVSSDGNYCAITNSDQHTVTFYTFDKKSNLIMENTPCFILQNPEAELHFPHGIAFSADGSFLAITQFGSIYVTEDGNILWNKRIAPSTAKVNLYSIGKKTISHTNI